MTTPRRRLPAWIWERVLTPIFYHCGCGALIWRDDSGIYVCQICDRVPASPPPIFR